LSPFNLSTVYLSRSCIAGRRRINGLLESRWKPSETTQCASRASMLRPPERHHSPATAQPPQRARREQAEGGQGPVTGLPTETRHNANTRTLCQKAACMSYPPRHGAPLGIQHNAHTRTLCGKAACMPYLRHFDWFDTFAPSESGASTSYAERSRTLSDTGGHGVPLCSAFRRSSC